MPDHSTLSPPSHILLDLLTIFDHFVQFWNFLYYSTSFLDIPRHCRLFLVNMIISHYSPLSHLHPSHSLIILHLFSPHHHPSLIPFSSSLAITHLTVLAIPFSHHPSPPRGLYIPHLAPTLTIPPLIRPFVCLR